MKKLLIILLVLVLGMFIRLAPVTAAGKADGQLCHDGTECASGNCTQSSNGRVCTPADIVNPNTLQVTDKTLDALDPLKTEGSPYATQFSTPGGIISRVLDFAFPLAAMILFVMIVVGGFQMVMGATTEKSVQEGQQRVTMAIVGFLLLFSSYWIAQILQSLLNIKIL